MALDAALRMRTRANLDKRSEPTHSEAAKDDDKTAADSGREEINISCRRLFIGERISKWMGRI